MAIRRGSVWSVWWLLAVVAATTIASAAQERSQAFEVASVKRAEPGTTGGGVRFLPGGRFVARNVPLDFLLQQIYGVRDYQIVAGPEWKPIIADGYGNRYDIEAKAKDESASRNTLMEMARTLLADRFSLRLHRDTRNLPVYALVLARGGAKSVRTSDGQTGGIELVANGWIRGDRVSIASLTAALSGYVDRPVIDRTGLDQVLDFNLTWAPLAAAGATDVASSCPSSFKDIVERRGLKIALSCPSLFTAMQEQLGLRLDPVEAPLDALVIDSVQRPTGN